mgnify:CR=1 FL=1
MKALHIQSTELHDTGVAVCAARVTESQGTSSGHLCSASQHLGGVRDVVGDVLAEWVADVLAQALQRLGAGDQGLHGKADEGNLRV